MNKLDNSKFSSEMNYNSFVNYNIDNSYKLDDSYLEGSYKLDKNNIEIMDDYNNYKMDNNVKNYDGRDIYKMKNKFSAYKVEQVDDIDGFENDGINKHGIEDEDTNYEFVNSNSSTNTGFNSVTPPNIQMIKYKLDSQNKALADDKVDNSFEVLADNRDYMNFYQPYQFYGNYHNGLMNQIPSFPMAPNNYNSLTMNMDRLNNSNINSINLEPIVRENSTIDNESIEDIDQSSQMPVITDMNLNKNMHDSISDRMINAIDMNDNEADIRPPPNRSDPIYTSISGLKWKSKSKKWVVRWDNPITNRRVYKYFSGNRYGFLGAHKRAKFYLEFLNASVGKINSTTPGNPFCRRTEGPPKGKTNKSLIRKYYSNNFIQYPDYINNNFVMNANNNYQPNYVPSNGDNGDMSNIDGASNNSNMDYFNYFYNNQDKAKNVEAGSSMDNPWYITQNFNVF
ncbi:conserved hypothetical protein [Theileria orientalis strain Shintoku]|uniref:AP2/ERF domain-containing protein n=1 Tax=Theileria orientalis strain Shintoku TaxID=869250 RepID=J4C4C6_THEOR|nr:conserved hypothetical protein [Theileria orientalis strain Shintoku]BAM41951.1 conserved hypothetical protein [Theileria orientalis strain Shintoku]|eukprot:XP_009692252.1 conserved hypothetical protein [Theileria orientalis strain Shintoku]